jgi:hypothetical protein
MPWVVRMQANPPVGGLQEPRQGCHLHVGVGPGAPRVALAAGGDGDVLGRQVRL